MPSLMERAAQFLALQDAELLESVTRDGGAQAEDELYAAEILEPADLEGLTPVEKLDVISATYISDAYYCDDSPRFVRSECYEPRLTINRTLLRHVVRGCINKLQRGQVAARDLRSFLEAQVWPDTTRPLRRVRRNRAASHSTKRYARLEARILKGDLDALLARWEFGRRLLEDKANRRHGEWMEVRKQISNALEISPSEISARMQFAEQYPVQDDARGAFKKYGSWSAICARGMGSRGESKAEVGPSLLGMAEAEVADLKAHPRNYKHHPPGQIEHLIKSIEEQGFYQPVVVALDNTILAGHGRVEAAVQMGWSRVPVIRLAVGPNEVFEQPIGRGRGRLDGPQRTERAEARDEARPQAGAACLCAYVSDPHAEDGADGILRAPRTGLDPVGASRVGASAGAVHVLDGLAPQRSAFARLAARRFQGQDHQARSWRDQEREGQGLPLLDAAGVEGGH